MQRWINRDPAQERGGFNLYELVGNEPLKRINAWGLMDKLPATVPGEADLITALINACKCRNMVKNAMYGAQAWANANYGGPGQMHSDEGSIADMLTHCVGACEVAKGEAVCKAAGIDARKYLQDRENGGVRGGDRMDMENNSIGFAIADSGQDCRQGCLKAFADGTLWTVDRNPPYGAHPVGNPPPPRPAPPKPKIR